MADVSDHSILEAYNQVRDDSSATNWLSLEYINDKSDKIIVAGKGTGGLAEFVAQLDENKAVYGYVRINVANDDLSNRAKFLLVSWCGAGVKVMRKAKLSVHLASVKTVCKVFAVELAASEKSDLDESAVLLLLKKAMGANYDRQTTSY